MSPTISVNEKNKKTEPIVIRKNWVTLRAGWYSSLLLDMTLSMTNIVNTGVITNSTGKLKT
jgi:hypothetical protein